MISYITPTDYKKEFIATLGIDILVLLMNIWKARITIIFRLDGRLIVSGEHLEQIKAQESQFFMQVSKTLN